MEKFMKEDVKLLFATESPGLGCDSPDIKHVIQFGYPNDLLTLVQGACGGEDLHLAVQWGGC